VRRGEPVALSDITLLEIANLFTRGKPRIEADIEQFFGELTGNPLIEILPLTVEIAMEVPLLTGLSDPADRAIVATARVHGLRLLTSDQRIIGAHLVPTIE
jgi:PIN domain nuclease of toxin-antitoxin system